MNYYPDSLDVRPLSTWPGGLTPTDSRRRSPFSAPLRSTLTILDRELWQLGAKHPVLEVAIDNAQFRIDGRPRSTARAEHPGVVLSLPTTNVGALRYATDRYLTWQDNLRAIALGLEALRKVDRYGITRRGEQYAGFKAIGSGIAMPPAAPAQMTVDEAARILTEHAGPGIVVSYRDLLDGMGGGGTQRAEYVTAAWRSAVKLHHPDVGGDRAAWDRIEQAKSVLDELGGSS
ncbi:MAG: heat shock protein DnaJ domain protein [Frankiales bacterium]|nr:heat shock protein DnaJ domain protein [Frankiales bacterium]